MLVDFLMVVTGSAVGVGFFLVGRNKWAMWTQERARQRRQRDWSPIIR